MSFTQTNQAVLLGTILLLTSAICLRAQTIYIGPASGDWGDVANWSAGVPTGGGSVVVDTRGQNSEVSTGVSQTRSVLDLDINAGDRVIVSNNGTLNINGAALNVDGELRIDSSSSFTTVNFTNSTVLAGTGSLSLSQNNNNSRLGGAGALTNAATIDGWGNIGLNQLAVTNAAGGVIDANVSAALNVGAILWVVPSPGDGLTNLGTMQASSGGILQLSGNGGFANDGGLIQAIGAGSEVQLRSNTSIVGGTLHTEDGGVIRGDTSQNYFFTDVTFDSGTQVVANNNSDFGVNGTITNEGTITVAAVSSFTDIELQDSTAFAGSGTVVLGIDNDNASINGTGTLTNTDNHTIRGRGNIGRNVLGIVNDGTITADAAGGILVIDPSAVGLDNNATLQALTGGTLQLSGGEGFANDGGLIQAIGAGSEVQLRSNASIVGGTLHTEDGGVIRGNTSENYFFRDVTFDSGTQVVANNNSDFGVNGTITNEGTITVAAVSSFTDIELQDSTAFAGSGTVVLGIDNDNASVNGTGTLTNTDNHTIRGRGNIGRNVLGIVNDGTITADAAGGILVIDPSAVGLDNNATLQAFTGSTLQLSGFGGGGFANDGGLIQAVGTGSEVQLLTNASIVGGTLHTEDGGVIRGNTSQNYFFTDVTFDSGTQVVANNNSDFGVNGTITNDGTITIAAGTSFTDIELQEDTAFAGSGTVVLGIDNDNAIVNGAGTLTNTDNHTIRGRGNIGFNLLGIVNDGTITADAAGGILAIDPSVEVGLDNNATLQALTGGTLWLSGFGGGGFANDGGLIQAVGAGSEVQLSTDTSIVGGTLHSEDGGVIRGNTSQNYFFTDVTFDSGTQVVANNNSDFGVLGTITNEGTITVAAGTSLTDIELQEDTVFTGNGAVVLGVDNNNARINGVGTLTNTDGHTIRGRGNLGVSAISVFNASDGTVAADVDQGALIVDPADGVGAFTNRGLLSSSNGGILQLSGSGGGTFDNVGGTIRAGDGSQVQLLNNTVIDGGRIETEGSGVVRLNISQTATISNTDISGSTAIENNGTLTLSRNIKHSGDLAINPGTSFTSLSIDSFLDLEGGGSISMNGARARILGNGVLINHDHQISGLGNIGVNQAAITNTTGGTIHANAAGTLTLDPNAFLGLTNDGIMRASNGGTLSLDGNGGSEFAIGETGVLEAFDGGTVTHTRNPVLTNLENGILSVGTYRAIDEGNGATLNLPGGDVLTNAANIELSGEGAEFSNLTTLAENVGRLSLLNGATLNTEGNFTQSATGTLEIGINGKPSDGGLWSKLVDAGEATLGGTLDVMFNIGNTFTAAIGNAWKFLTSSERTGEFSDVTFTSEGLPENSELAVNYLDDGVELEVVPVSAELVAGATYASWAANLPAGMDPDPAADPDGDGASNLQEYAFAMDPMASDSDLLPQPQLVRSGGQAFAAIRYVRFAGGDAPSDIAYVIEQSVDLEKWTPADVESDSLIDDSNQFENIIARCVDSLGASEGQCAYLRVSLERREW